MIRILLVLTFAAGLTHGQVDPGTISGLARDASGAAVAGARISILEENTGRLRLDVSRRVPVDFGLAVGAVTQSVEVTEAGAILQTESSTLSNLRTEKAIKDLPLNGRNCAVR